MLLRITGFHGANKALHPILLPDAVGVDSRNQKPGRGDLRPWGAANTVATVANGSQTIYRMGRSAPSDTDYWLAWAADVNVARSFIAQDTTERTYWSGDGAPKWTDNTIGLGAPPYPDSSGVRLLGVPKPNATPTLAEQVAGTGDDETRAYVTTWVNDKSEESMPSAAALITCKPGATIRITRNATIPAGAYGLTAWRIYRTLAGNENDYYFVAEIASATTSYDESGAVNTASALLSEGWAEPPSTLKGLKTLWNGIMAGFVGKSLRFCEPFRPYAWPEGYELILDDDIVALGRWRQSLIVLTVGQPYIVTGSHPDAMSVQLIEMNQACVAKKGVVEFGHGVVWPSPDGLAFMGDGGARVLTAGLAMPEDWQAFVPSSMVAGEHKGLYVCSYNPGNGRKSLVIDPLNPSGFYFCDIGFSGCYRDPIADALYLLDGTNVKRWDTGSALTASHTSKTFRTEKPTSFALAQVVADSYPVTFTLYAQGLTMMEDYTVKNGRPFRLPDGFLTDQWAVKVSTASAVQAVLLAHSSAELNLS